MFFPLKDDRSRPGFAPIGIYVLLLLNLAVFGFEMKLLFQGGEGDLRAFISHYGCVPAEVFAGTGLIGLLSSMFLHAGVWHLAGNMLFLWVFGDNVEDLLGTLPFLFFYLLCGVVAAGTDAALRLHSMVPALGASGAVSGIMGAYIWSFPRNNIVTFYWFLWRVGTLRCPAWLYLGFWFALQLLLHLTPEAGKGGGVAYGAHIGGFVAGILLVHLFGKRRAALKYYRRGR